MPGGGDVVIIGAGQAGLAVSRELTARGVEHVVLERGRVAEAWRGRWDSFCLVTPNWTVRLPGGAYAGDDPDGFMGRDDVVAHLERYAADAPVRAGVDVTALRAQNGGFGLETTEGELTARAVVVATGAYQRPHRPAARRIWRAAAHHGRHGGSAVATCCGGPRRPDSSTRRCPRPRLASPRTSRPRGTAAATTCTTGPCRRSASACSAASSAPTTTAPASPTTSGPAWPGATPATPTSCAWSHGPASSAACHCRTTPIRGRSTTRGRPSWISAASPRCSSRPATRPDYARWIDVPGAFDERGFPLHADGASAATDGLYFAGVHFLRKRKSSLLIGVGEDAELVAGAVAENPA